MPAGEAHVDIVVRLTQREWDMFKWVAQDPDHERRILVHSWRVAVEEPLADRRATERRRRQGWHARRFRAA